MTFDELEAFVSIANGGGFTRASRELHRSQPAISRRMRQLEGSLGAALFERVGRGVRLTGAGQALLPHAETALAALRDGQRAVRALGRKATTTPPLRVALVGSLADLHVVRALRAFRRRFGGASIELRTASSREVSALVRRGEADLGVRYFAEADPKLVSTALGHERLHVVVPASHRVRARRVRDLRAFAGEKWLGFPPDPRHPESSVAELERQLVAAGAGRPAIAHVDSLTAQKRLVEAGLGVALLPRGSFREELARKSLRTVEVSSLRVEQPVVVVQRRSGYTSPLAAPFLELLVRATRNSLTSRARPG